MIGSDSDIQRIWRDLTIHAAPVDRHDDWLLIRKEANLPQNNQETSLIPPWMSSPRDDFENENAALSIGRLFEA